MKAHKLIELLKQDLADRDDLFSFLQMFLNRLQEVIEERDDAYEMLYANHFVLDEETNQWREE